MKLLKNSYEIIAKELAQDKYRLLDFRSALNLHIYGKTYHY